MGSWQTFVLVSLTSCSLIVDLGDLGKGTDGGVDASSDGPAPLAVECKGSASCTPPDICCGECNDGDSGGCNYQFTCMSASACPGLPLACSDPGSCGSAGQVCCALLGGGGAYLDTTECSTAAECDASAPSTYLCDPNVATPCPYGGVCLLSKRAGFADYYECR